MRPPAEAGQRPERGGPFDVPELTWEGKYDAKGRKVAPLRVSLPFQTVETVNESSQDRQRSLDLFSSGRDPEWRNSLIWGDNKYVLPALLQDLAGRVDLIYADPPFGTGQDFSIKAHAGAEEFVKEPSMIEQKVYRDTWGRGLDSYLQMLYQRLLLLREALAETGSIFIHLDVHVGPYVKLMMDDVFGRENFQNQIAWYYYNKLHGATKHLLPKAYDVILYYVKNREAHYTYHTLTEPRDRPVKKIKYRFVKGKIINVKDESGKTVTYESTERQIDNVWRIRALQPANAAEWVDFPTQKPVDLIERVLQVASDPGDLVLDPFCGSGTTLVAAERQGRRWVGIDVSRFAIHTSRKRLISVTNVGPFVVRNLGKYERQLWQRAEFGELAESRSIAYRKFILELYRASPIEGYTWLHGLREGRMVHVGGVDAPVTVGDVKQIAVEFKKAVGTGKDAPKSSGVDVLGWDFAFEVNEVARQEAAEANILMRFIRIPREVLDKRAVEQGDVKFFELAALSVDIARKGRMVTLKLTDFMIPLDDVPDDVQRVVKSWRQWIDYWAVDWDNQGDTFHNEWQSYRTRERKQLETAVSYEYERPGTYKVVVKVIDILGNDTTKTLKVEVP
jgi:adenine-specific DNA-methyltransferase